MKRGKLQKNAGFVVAAVIVLLAVMGGTAASVYAARGQGQGEPLATGEVGTEAAEEDSGVLPEDFEGPSGEIDAVKNDIAELKVSSGEGSPDGAAQIRVLEERQSGLEAELVTVDGLLEALEEQKARITVMGVQLDSTRLELVASVDEVRVGLEQLIGDLASQAGEFDDKIMEYVDELKGVCDDLENGKVEAGDFSVYKSSIADTLEKLKAELSSLMKAGDEALARELSESSKALAQELSNSTEVVTGRIIANEDSIAGINDAMDELKKSVSDGKSSLASAITVEGVATSSDASYAVLADNVGRLSAARYNAGYGAGVLDTKKGTATAGMVLVGSTFTSALGVEMEGDMPDNGSLDWKPSGPETYNVPFGYYSGGTLDSSEAYNSGVSEGYDSGYGKGKSDGYATGYSKGTSEGYDSGYSKGTSDGYATGYNKGTSEGYNSGYSKGKSDGYDSGYSQGYNAGYKDADKEMVYYSGWLSPAYSYEEGDEDECYAFVLKLPSCSWSMARTNAGNGYAGNNWIHGGPTEYTFKGPNWHANDDYSTIWVEAWYLPE